MNKAKLAVLYSILCSAIIICVLIFSLFTLKDLLGDGTISKMYFVLTFLFLAVSRIPLAIKGIRVDKSKIVTIKNFAFSVIYLVLTILLFTLEVQGTLCAIICSVYFFTIAANRICSMIEKKRVSSYIFNSLLAIVSILIAFLVLAMMDDSLIIVTMITSLFVIMLVALAEILVFALSRIQLKGIIKIMRKTYAFEILYGLAVLMIASSFFFSFMEDSIPTFLDGLWYSFAVVTTIGFGDFTVTSVASRILTVILGIYGLIVVAVITSIIINFYNEVKDKKDDEEDEDDNNNQGELK